MLVGLMSDTHDRLPMVDKAVERLNSEDVELVLHAGDYIAPFAAQRLGALKAKVIGVLGNNDGDAHLLKSRFEDFGGELRGLFAEVRVDGLKIALLHGHLEELLKSLVESGGYQVVVHGHTHKAGARRVNGTLVVNPGEVCGYLSGKSTVAVLDTKTLEVRFLEL